jgi:hypothetical protein
MAWLIAAPAWALKLRTLADYLGPGVDVLLIYDCGSIGVKEECTEDEAGFSAGDGAMVAQQLRSKSYAQVWLNSGGGDLAEGVKVGEALRDYKQFVVVPKGMTCVSSCTVAFLGGVIREVDPQGSYQVHAYSRVMMATPKYLERFTGEDGEINLDDFARDTEPGARGQAKKLFMYVQRMIGGVNDAQAVDAALSLASGPYKNYRGSAQWKADLQHIKSGGIAAAQEVLMRLERSSFETYLNALIASSPDLGRRARQAAHMLEIMFSSRIQGTFPLDQKTLKENGYINYVRP